MPACIHHHKENPLSRIHGKEGLLLVVNDDRHTNGNGIEQLLGHRPFQVETAVRAVVHIDAAAVSTAGKIVESASAVVEFHPVIDPAAIALHLHGAQVLAGLHVEHLADAAGCAALPVGLRAGNEIILHDNGAEVIGVRMNTNLDTCIKRRDGQISADVMHNINKRMIPLADNEVDTVIDVVGE